MMDLVKEVASALMESIHAIAFTGAGISTASGIPDFRGPNGLWKKYSPELASITYLMSNPKGFWEFYAFRMKGLFEALPNPAHYALAELEKMGIIKYVITQNIDGLHQMAGSKNVIEIHGSMRRFYCMGCNTRYTLEEVMKKINSGQIPPLCDRCSGTIRPDVVLFGEPVYQIQEALDIASSSDLVLSIGSSLSVYPANLVPRTVKDYGGKLIIINGEPTELDDLADIIVRDRVEVFLPKVVEEVKRMKSNESR
ncbi:MAG: NAD-dependent protein deacetylase [Sulfolobaceae archaeon]|nr:NAD-dependent protein deacetylase [Sulfolobaceae archaeon]